jgi:putative glutamine amidotransferase
MNHARRPLIGLTGRVAPGSDFAGFPASFAAVEVDMYVSAYARAITAAGGLPVHLPQHVPVGDYADVLDGVVLSGGADVHPGRYGEAATTDVFPPEPPRDEMELALVDAALAGDVPLLGICRGLQLLNVQAGGSLNQHVPEQARFDVRPDELIDEVRLEPGTRLHAMYGDRLAINSLHHQTIARVGAGWTVAGRGPDGSVEAIEWPGRDAIGVQWHPEMLAGAVSDPLFRWLVEAAAARRSRRWR